jgi:uncharacterized damage-inducible protein DinB
MTPDSIRIPLDYNYWARDRVRASAEHVSRGRLSRTLESSSGSVLDTVVHIDLAGWIWYRRWLREHSVSAR